MNLESPVIASSILASARPRVTTSLLVRTAKGAHSLIACAQRRALGTRSPTGTTSLTRPRRRPSSADTWRPVRIMPSACFEPICRGKRCRPPMLEASPNLGSGRLKEAVSAAMIKSHANAASNPGPSATPLTAAMMGLVRRKLCVSPAKPVSGMWYRLAAAGSCGSLPAQNALSPRPVRIATLARRSPR